jgi:hypothetical protein
MRKMPQLARALITIVTLLTLAGSNLADWNHTHIFSEMWSPHARFHGVWFVITVTLLSLLSLWLVWSENCQPDRTRIAAFVQGCIWLAFFPGRLVSGTLLADPTREVELLGIDLNLLGAVFDIVLLGIALILLRRSSGQDTGQARRVVS